MARNVSGTHSLPAGNPVTTGTTIDSTWANTTLDDLSDEITDSLSRSGKGGMTAPVRCADGDATAPAFSFTSETGTGWYRSAAGVLRAAILGTYRLLLNATGLQVNGTLQSSGKIIGSAGLDVTGQVAVVDDGGTSKKVTVDAPTGLAADYALVLPTGLPASTALLTVTSAGVIGASATPTLSTTITAASGNAITATGQGAGSGLSGTGGGTSGNGLYGAGGAPNGNGVTGAGKGSGVGVFGVGELTGGGADGTGVLGTGGVTNGIGVEGVGAGTGTGVKGSSVTGYGGAFTGNATRAPLRIVPQAATPSTAAAGDLYYDSDTNTLLLYTGAGWVTVQTA